MIRSLIRGLAAIAIAVSVAVPSAGLVSAEPTETSTEPVPPPVEQPVIEEMPSEESGVQPEVPQPSVVETPAVSPSETQVPSSTPDLPPDTVEQTPSQESSSIVPSPEDIPPVISDTGNTDSVQGPDISQTQGENADTTEPSEPVLVPENTVSNSPVAEVTEPIELSKPVGSNPIPDAIATQVPIEVTAANADTDDVSRQSRSNGPHAPKPGQDQPSNPWQNDQVQQFPTATDIDIKGDDNTVTVINNITNVQQITNNINITDIDVTKIENRQDWLYLHNIEHPDLVLRVAAEFGHPVRLNPGWCGGIGGAWSFSAAVAGDNFAAAFSGSGVFYSNNGCGYSPPPKHPPQYPDQLYVCPPRGQHGLPVHQGNYQILSQTLVYAPEYNIYYYGNWETRTVNQKPQKVFALTQGWSPDTVFQQKPIPGAPPPIKGRWGGVESSEPTGIYALQQYAREHMPLTIALAVLIGVATVGASVALSRTKKDARH